MTYLQKVKQFQKTFNLPSNSTPHLLDPAYHKLRYALMQEELDEYKEACEKGDIIEILDSLIDQKYILNGTIDGHGLSDLFDEGFNLVHENNMSKVCSNLMEVERTLELYEKQGIEVTFKDVENGYIVFRTSDGKVLKPYSFVAVNLKQLFKDKITQCIE